VIAVTVRYFHEISAAVAKQFAETQSDPRSAPLIIKGLALSIPGIEN